MGRSLLDAQSRALERLDRVTRAVERRFEIDLRALAVFRLAIGSLLIGDLVLRSRNLIAFYTDDGVLPRAALFSVYPSAYSLHALSGKAWVQALLFCVAGAAALAVLVGYRTRIATVASTVLLISLHIRNPLVLNGGDLLLRMLLLWGMFLPLGERWSVDARRINRDRTTVSSVGTLAVLSQVMLVYAVNAVHKSRSDAWMSGDAVAAIFRADQFTILLGNAIAEQTHLLRAATHLWMVLVLLSPLLIILTGYRRALFASLFVGMHLGMLVTVRVGIFPLVSVTGLILFYPSVVWDGLTALAAQAGATPRLRSGLTRFQRAIPRVSFPLFPSVRATIPSLTAVTNPCRVLLSTVVPWLLLVLVVLASIQAVSTEVPEPAEQVIETTHAEQPWRMFAPDPISNARWLVVPGRLDDGTETDVLHGSAVDWDRPPSVDRTYESARWRKYVSNMRYADNENHHSYFANYLCGRWNATHERGVDWLTIYGMTDRAAPYEEPDIEKYKLLEYDCSGEFVQTE
ncbi:HTTM domain-containing protein [Natrinema sp. 1APR25-10V2]|uniref:HTTM domain-containing protein n=1 Tax=Natrinema sp. 1APR25-10V2 TaxID=2951081 RepID=UPI002876F7A1|nr:HTTM domain-containing protein [Natrinema sp. 1APR25-10V2]MDS0473891.1 HTTM domain-containing protein [Natrinema sp. 1APR25-10V2]